MIFLRAGFSSGEYIRTTSGSVSLIPPPAATTPQVDMGKRFPLRKGEFVMLCAQS